MISLTCTLQVGEQTIRHAVQPEAIVEIVEDPRETAISRSIVKIATGAKLYCTESYDEVLALVNGSK